MSAEPPGLHAEGARTWVTTVREDDLAPYQSAVEQSWERLAPWNPVNPGDLLSHLHAQSRNHRTFVIHAREPRGDHDIVGKVNVTGVSRGRFLSASLGYDAYDPYAGHGLFAEGMRLVIGLAFAAEPAGMGLHRLEANVQPANVRSAGMLRSLGFSYEGFSPRMLWLSDAHGTERWRDHDRYALTAEGWPGEAYVARAARRLVAVVNGPRGDARTRLANALAGELGVPLLSTDQVAQALAASASAGEAAGGPVLTLALPDEAAERIVWRLLEASPPGGVVEGWFRAGDPARRVDAALRRAGLDPARVPEVWCDLAGAGAAALGLGLGPVHVVDAGVPLLPALVTSLALVVRSAAAG